MGDEEATRDGNRVTGLLAGNYLEPDGRGTVRLVADPVTRRLLVQAIGTVATTSANYATRIDTTSTAGMIYIGNAAIGSSETDAVWQIKRLNTNSIALDKRWAYGSDSFTNKWSERVSPITYS